MTRTQRHLLLSPILHQGADMGSLHAGLRAAYVRAYGRRRWQQHAAEIDAFWENVRGRLDALDVEWAGVYLYQDGLPLCGRERAIAEQAARQGSENYRLLIDLADRGAHLVGTEDPRLLAAELALLRDRLRHNVAEARAKELLSDRDAFMARRIGQTLPPGHTGLLLLGLQHDIEPQLPADVSVARLDVAPWGPARARKQPRPT